MNTIKKIAPTEVQTWKIDTPKQVGKTTEVNGQTAKEVDTQQNKKMHVRDTTKTQPNSIKHSESTNRYNCQQKVGIDTTTQNKTTTQEQVNSTPQTTQTDITQTEAYYPTEAKRLTHTPHNTRHNIRRGNRPLWQRRRETHLPQQINRP